MKYLAASVVFAIALSTSVRAHGGYVYATSVHSHSGTFDGSNVDESYFLTTLGAPDAIGGVSGVIQFDAGSTLTLDFGSVMTGSGILSVYTYDNEYPAAARVETSVDGSRFSLLAARLPDTNGPIGPPYPHADLVIASPFRYVRFTDVGTEPAGFDLDAVGFLGAAAPEPATWVLVGIGLLPALLRARRRLVAESA